MSRLIPKKIDVAPLPSDAFIKSKIISKGEILPLLAEQILSYLKELCEFSPIRAWIKFVIYQPNFYLEIVDPSILSKGAGADFKYDSVIPRTGSIRIAASVNVNTLLKFFNLLEHEFWHAAQFFLHHPPLINPQPECVTTIGNYNNYPFLPLTIHSFNHHWQLLFAVAQSLRLVVKQLEQYISGTLPFTTNFLPEPSRTIVEVMKHTRYTMSLAEQSICPPAVQMQLSRQNANQIIWADPLSLIKRRYSPVASTKNIGQIECIAHMSCEQSDHPICKTLDWAAFAIRRISGYEHINNVKFTPSFSANLNGSSLVFWNLLLKKLPQNSLAHGLVKLDVYSALKFELGISNTVLQGLSPEDGYKLVLKEAKTSLPEFQRDLALLQVKIEHGQRLITETDTILMTELGDTIFQIKEYQKISAQHEKSIDLWLDLCSNGTATVHLPHPEECLIQPARCGEPPNTQPILPVQILQTTVTSCVTSFMLQGLKHKVSAKNFNKISSVIEWSALVACAGSNLGTLAFVLIQGAKFANRRFRWFSESKADVAVRALPMAGLFISPTNTLVQTSITLASSLTGTMLGSKLADWAMSNR